MIGSLRGTVLDRSTLGEALVEVYGIGYRVAVTPGTLADLREGAEVFLHVHHHVREDTETLFGFLSKDERQCFEALIGAHGVGPSLAMGILGVHQPDALRHAVAANDEAALCLVPGVGKKTAARLLIELKSRLDVPDTSAPTAVAGGSNTLTEVREALTGLGYGADEVREVLRTVTTGGDSATMLREALRQLGSRRA
jgi:holliday junction DNA helicase RuvA